MRIMTAQSGLGRQERDAHGNVVSILFWGALIVATLAGLLFCLYPQLDLATSGYFYLGNGVFSGKGGGVFAGGAPRTLADYVRLTLYFSFIAVCVVNVIGLIASSVLKSDVFGLGFVRWLFLAACLALGPGLVGNVMLKDGWGRARPVQIKEFGGSKKYSLPIVRSDQCRRNCSFVAGEASMMYATFFASAFIFPAIGGALVAAGIGFGLLAGFIRISQGAHFLSDVIFAGVTMALTVVTIYLVFRTIARLRDARRGEKIKDPLTGQRLW